jgi:adenine-specific DNA-methyltransferase
LGLTVSTGRVVDFRVRDKLRDMPGRSDAPLIYPGHLRTGRLHWPYPELKKPNAITREADTEKLLLPHGTYVAVRRFSTKEERRRVFASVVEASRLPDGSVGFENHLNVFHCEGAGFSEDLAWGLAAFLNSSSVDAFFRQFNGHTQVNATDLRSLRYPAHADLEVIGRRTREPVTDQAAIDALVAEFGPSLDAGAEANALR